LLTVLTASEYNIPDFIKLSFRGIPGHAVVELTRYTQGFYHISVKKPLIGQVMDGIKHTHIIEKIILLHQMFCVERYERALPVIAMYDITFPIKGP
jgi:hypothetical protein